MKSILILLFIGLQALYSVAQPQRVTGKVVAAMTLEPLSGATIYESERVVGIAGKDGSFTVTVSVPGATLRITHAGYKEATLKTDAQKTDGYLVALEEDAKTIGEVVVSTGYQQLPKERLTGSFEKIDQKLFIRQTNPNVLQRLDGIATGLLYTRFPGGDEITIRGLSTITANTQPLVVVDNFPYAGDISNINTNDIADITILKDAAAASIWGARSGNGVIVITTKKGSFAQPLRISLNAGISLQKQPEIMSDRNFISSADYIGIERFLFNKGFYDNDLNDIYSRPLVSPVVEILNKGRNGELTSEQADIAIGNIAEYDIRRDILKYLYRTGIAQEYALGLSGGSAAINYHFNFGYNANVSNTVGNRSDRLTFSNSTGLQIAPKLFIQFGINYSLQIGTQNGLNILGPVSRKIYPYTQLAGPGGEALSVDKDYRESYLDTAGIGFLQNWKYVPLDELKYADNTSESQDVLVRLKAKYDVSSSLSFEFSGQAEKTNGMQRNFYGRETYYTRNLINLYTQVSNGSVNYNIPLGGILDLRNSLLSSISGRAQANYNKIWNSDHELHAIAGSEISNTLIKSNANRTYGYNENNLNFSAVDYVTEFPAYDNLRSSSSIPNSQQFTEITNRLVSVFTNLGYTFKNKYSLSASARRDASNLFGVSTNNKWSPFWSAGIGWEISKETFYKIKNLPFLRARLTYGYNGNINNSVAAVPTIELFPASNQTTNLLWAQVKNLTNKNLRWERSGIVNAGIDFRAFGGSMEGTLEYYQKRSVDLISPVTIDPTTGISLMQLNVASIQTTGVDVRLHFIPVNKKIKLETSLLFSHVKNVVTKYMNEFLNKSGYVNFSYSINPREGQDPYAITSYRFGGLDSAGNPIGYLNGSESKDYLKIVNAATWSDLRSTGSSRPTTFGNLVNTLSYKEFSLTFNIAYRFGYYFRRNTISYSALFSSGAGHADYYDRWQQPGDEKTTNIPSLVFPSNTYRDIFYINSEATVSKADNIRVQDISLSYRFPTKDHTPAVLNGMQLYCFATNIGFAWRANKYGLDPDYGTAMPAPFILSFGFRKNL